MSKINLRARHRARILAVQALYEWHVSGNPVDEIRISALADHKKDKVDAEYFNECVVNIASAATQLDTDLHPFLDRSLDDITPIELAILRLGLYELQQRIDVPYKVVINEAVEMGKVFGAAQSHKYINGVLDKAAHQIRIHEIHR